MLDTPRYKELQEKLASQTDEKGRIDTLLGIAEEIKNFDVDEAMKEINTYVANPEQEMIRWRKLLD